MTGWKIVTTKDTNDVYVQTPFRTEEGYLALYMPDQVAAQTFIENISKIATIPIKRYYTRANKRILKV